MIDSVAGMISAPPMPMNARLAMSWSGEVDRADSSDPVPNTKNPACSAGRRPNLSPRLPIVSRRPANTSVYESTIHCSWLLVAFSSRTIDGNATFRIELSSTMTRRLKQRTPRMSQRRSSAFSWTRSVKVVIAIPSRLGVGIRPECGTSAFRFGVTIPTPRSPRQRRRSAGGLSRRRR